MSSGIVLGSWSLKNVRRFDYAMEHEPEFTDREIQAINERAIFVGMREDALISALWYQKHINRSSYGPDQWVYTNAYVYVDRGVVEGWN